LGKVILSFEPALPYLRARWATY